MQRSKVLKYLTTLVLLAVSNGCTNIAVVHKAYCETFSEEKRHAFRELTDNTIRIECDG